ncbi:MAG: hypothetical protein QOK16_19, partial [Solirubrobacteraceae bacterium]|nr:hypothetical protein [Solirubrobacteraceae bacterium]
MPICVFFVSGGVPDFWLYNRQTPNTPPP